MYNLKDGWYRLKIYAEDLAGNQEEQESVLQ